MTVKQLPLKYPVFAGAVGEFLGSLHRSAGAAALTRAVSDPLLMSSSRSRSAAHRVHACLHLFGR